MSQGDDARPHGQLPPMTIRLLGQASVTIGQKSWTLDLKNQKQKLLYMLALAPKDNQSRGRALSTYEIRKRIWWDTSEEEFESTRDNLKTLKSWLITDIAQALGGRARTRAYLQRRTTSSDNQNREPIEMFVLCPRATLRIDVDTFTSHYIRGLYEHDSAGQLKAYQSAVDEYRGPLLADERLVPGAERYRRKLEARFKRAKHRRNQALIACIQENLDRGLAATAEAGISRLKALAEDDVSLVGFVRALSARAATQQFTWTMESSPTPDVPTESVYMLERPATKFIGRRDDLRRLAALATEQRLVTLVGPGGVGKTRMAIELALHRPRGWFDVVVMVRLELITRNEQVSQQMAAVLGLYDSADRDPTDGIVKMLASKRALIILDSCEHVIAGARALCKRLLDECPGVRILAASQCPLGIAEELSPFTVGLLPTPPETVVVPADASLHLDSIQLFLYYALLAKPDFVWTAETRADIVAICSRLDGLPLALELAAARLSNMPLHELATNIVAALPILQRTTPPTSPRHLTMADTIRWTYSLLTEREQRLFHRLAVFTGSFSAAAARDICSDDQLSAADIEQDIHVLVKTSLVLEETSAGETRYRLLQVLREFALALPHGGDLPGEPPIDGLRHAHALWYAAFAEGERPHLRTEHQLAALRALNTEHPNLRAAIQWAQDHDETKIVLRLASSLWRFWWMCGEFTPGCQMLAATLQMPGTLPTPEEAICGLTADALCGLAMLTAEQGKYAEALSQIERSISLREQIHDQPGLAESLGIAGRIAYGNNDPDGAYAYIRRSLELWEQLDNSCGIADAHKNMGTALYYLGKLRDAHQHLDLCLEQYRSCRDYTGIGYALINLANVHYRFELHDDAEALYLESLALRWMLGSRMGIATCLQGMIWNARRQEKFCRAAWLFGVEEGLRKDLALHIPPQDQREYDDHIKAARESLGVNRRGQDVFELIRADARETPLDQALAALLAATPESPASASGTTHGPHPYFARLRGQLAKDLSRRELQVARLTADGYTARGIADMLRVRRTPKPIVTDPPGDLGRRRRSGRDINITGMRADIAVKVRQLLQAEIATLMDGR